METYKKFFWSLILPGPILLLIFLSLIALANRQVDGSWFLSWFYRIERILPYIVLIALIVSLISTFALIIAQMATGEWPNSALRIVIYLWIFLFLVWRFGPGSHR